MTRLYHQFLNFLAEKRTSSVNAEKEAEMFGRHVKRVRLEKEQLNGGRYVSVSHAGEDNSRTMAHSVIIHRGGKVHVRTDLTTGKTEVAHEKNTLNENSDDHSVIQKLKADGKHEEAGREAFKRGLGRAYGANYGELSAKQTAVEAFYRGYDRASSERKKKN